MLPQDIESEPSQQDRARAALEIQKELTPDHASALHPTIPLLPESKFSDLIEQEISRKAAGLPLEKGVDLSRYEALDPPPTDPVSDDARPDIINEWRSVLQKAYASSTHLQTRLTNLALLEEFGKNAWLIGNSQLEDILRGLERDLATTREQVETVNKARKAAQEAVRGEKEGLEESWQMGIGKVIEVEIAAEKLRQEILDRRRALARG